MNKVLNNLAKDIEQSEWWLRGESEESMTLEEISLLARKGFTTCKDHCLSKLNCGEECCTCIRSTFPTPAYYELYKEARCFYLMKLAEGAVIAVASNNGEKNNDS